MIETTSTQIGGKQSLADASGRTDVEDMQSKAVIGKDEKKKRETIDKRNHKHTDRRGTELGG